MELLAAICSLTSNAALVGFFTGGLYFSAGGLYSSSELVEVVVEGVEEEVSETASLCARVKRCGQLPAFLLFFGGGRGGTEVEEDGG